MNFFLRSFSRSSLGDFLWYVGDLFQLLTEFLGSLVRRPASRSAVLNELYKIGVQSFVIVMVATLATGLVMSIQFGFGLARFGAKLYVPKILATSIFRELGPIFTALMVAGRVGAGIAAEVGSMKVTQQIDAMRALGTSPMQKLLAPKIVAATLACPLLTVFGNFFGLLGGIIISNSQLGVSAYDFFFKAFEILNIRDFAGGLIKATAFGFLVGLVGCYSGLRARGGTQGVGEATTQSVVISSILVLLFDFLLTKLLWMIEHAVRGGKL